MRHVLPGIVDAGHLDAGIAEVGGVVAGVGQRVLSGVAKFLAGRFFKALEKHIDESKKEAKDTTAV